MALAEPDEPIERVGGAVDELPEKHLVDAAARRAEPALGKYLLVHALGHDADVVSVGDARGALFRHGDAQAELRAADGGGKAGGARADDDHVGLYDFKRLGPELGALFPGAASGLGTVGI